MNPRRIPIIEIALAALAMRAVAHYAEPILDAMIPNSHETPPDSRP